MKSAELLSAWGRILTGHTPSLSVEITRECPLKCPGCYAYNDDHLNDTVTLRELRDYKGRELVDGMLALVREHKPLHLSVVGGDPLVRLAELEELLPQLTAMGIHCQIVTSAFRRIPPHWRENPKIAVVVSVDGLQPDHDVRRRPATYDRILRNIEGCEISIHCTVTRQMAGRADYFEEFLEFWHPRREIKRVWMSLYTPQIGEISAERLTAPDRESVVRTLLELRPRYDKLHMSKAIADAFLSPPASPSECLFSTTTKTISADLTTTITPCQLGGKPNCSECGCVASVGLHAIGRYRFPGGVSAGAVYRASAKVGRAVLRARGAGAAS